jgi:hypothetical protein
MPAVHPRPKILLPQPVNRQASGLLPNNRLLQDAKMQKANAKLPFLAKKDKTHPILLAPQPHGQKTSPKCAQTESA